MTKIINIHSVKETKLWKHLEGDFKNDDGTQPEIVQQLLSSVLALSQEGQDRMKIMPHFHPQFTLHDAQHLLRVTEIMGLLLGDVIEKINPIETGLLILSAHFHDQGMILDGNEIQALQTAPDYKIHSDLWNVEHPNIKELEAHFASPFITQKEKEKVGYKLAELKYSILIDYIRQKHAVNSRGYVLKHYSEDKRLDFFGDNISDHLATLCHSHNQTLDEIKAIPYSTLIGGEEVNLRYLAILLRLADILDFDRDRTPEILFRAIHFTNNVSLQEWEKHRGVRGWQIEKHDIRFEMKFDHPVYEKTAREFLKWVDCELTSAKDLLHSMPGKYYDRYPLYIPQKTSSVFHSNNYIYHDLEFSLSRDEIVKLLMTENLYSDTSLCVRELLQNSLDALRYRKALLKTEGFGFNDGVVEFEHYIDDDGYEVLICKDNGIGMDENVIQNYLTRTGRSYYKSTYFEQERIHFRESGVDFDPCSQFGIGFMSCFMLGDRITIETMRDYGIGNQHGKSLVIEINGLNGLLVIRNGKQKKPGTTVKIVSREKPFVVDRWSDHVRLNTVLQGYAIATEFPIKAICKVPGIEETITIPTDIECPSTFLEGINEVVAEDKITFEVDFNEVDSGLNGKMRETFLLNKKGVPSAKNEIGKFIDIAQNNTKEMGLLLENKKFIGKSRYSFSSQVGLDGILVSGDPGRGNRKQYLSHYANIIRSGSLFTLDIRGNIKPKLNPSRVPPSRGMYDCPPSWHRIQHYLDHANGKLWQKVVEFIPKGLNHADLWKLVAIYGGDLTNLSGKDIITYLSVTLTDKSGRSVWKQIKELGRVIVEIKIEEKKDESINYLWHICTESEGCIEYILSEIHPNAAVSDMMRSIVVLTSKLSIKDDKIFLTPNIQTIGDEPASFNKIEGIYLIPYERDLKDVLSVSSPLRTINIKHPFARCLTESQFKEHKEPLELFIESFCRLISDYEDILSFEKHKITRMKKYVAHRYISVNWDAIDDSFKPPYTIWHEKQGFIEITDDDFKKWAAEKVS